MVVIILENPLKMVDSVTLEISRGHMTGDNYHIFALKGSRRVLIAELTRKLEILLADLAMEVEGWAIQNRIPRVAFLDWIQSRKAHSTANQGELWSAFVRGDKLYNISLVSTTQPYGSTLLITPGPLQKGFNLYYKI